MKPSLKLFVSKLEQFEWNVRKAESMRIRMDKKISTVLNRTNRLEKELIQLYETRGV